ncbi:MAG: type III-B CRISPR-associated protein Cas10/Cmr2 [Thermoprotei archaeon]|nr:MAG: type III-B CRISPR-associated protein Cas10/Cmr2 [Thermoprotei archaeon]
MIDGEVMLKKPEVDGTFWRRKITAILHDPPWKPWVIAKGFSVYGKKRHEEEAYELAKDLGLEQDFTYGWAVRLADGLAASFDRWLLDILGVVPGIFEFKGVELKNPFAVRVCETSVDVVGRYIPPLEPEPRVIKDSFVRFLSDILKSLGDPKARYYMLYTLYEFAWWRASLPIGPADTRVPTHSVFDHVYATSTMINLVKEEDKIAGYLGLLDLAGVQKFIQASRKLRDFYIASWLSSVLSWKLVEDFVLLYGPDVLLMPSPRNNPFYLHTFLTANIDGETVYEFLSKLPGFKSWLPELAIWYGYIYSDLTGKFKVANYPMYAVVPTTITLVLPSEQNALHNLLMIPSMYSKIWSALCDCAANALDELSRSRVEALKGLESSLRSLLKTLGKTSEGSLKDMFTTTVHELGYTIAPPLPLRLTVLYFELERFEDSCIRCPRRELCPLKALRERGFTVYTRCWIVRQFRSIIPDAGEEEIKPEALSKVLRELLPWFKELDIRGRELVLLDFELYHLLLSLIFKLQEMYWSTKLDAAAGTNLTDRYEKVYTSIGTSASTVGELLRESCSVCGKLPPIVTIRGTDLEPYFSDGERLCGYCLIKRLLSTREGTKHVVGRLLGREVGEQFFEVPSISDIANLKFLAIYIKMVREAMKSRERLKDLVSRLESCVGYPKLVEGLDEWVGKLRGTWLRYYVDEIVKADKRLALPLVWMWKASSINDDFIEPKTPHLRDLRNFYVDVTKIDRLKFPTRYLALVKADGDYMGKLLQGNISKALHPKLKCEWLIRYLAALCEGRAAEVVNYLAQGDLENAVNVLLEELGKVKERIEDVKVPARHEDLLEHVRCVKEYLDKLAKEGLIPTAPAWHTSVSRALMVQSLVDIIATYRGTRVKYRSVEVSIPFRGFVVYAGGDDYFAAIPIDYVLDMIYETRAAYSIGASVKFTIRGYMLEVPEDGFNVGIEKRDKVPFFHCIVVGERPYVPIAPALGLAGRSYCAYYTHYMYPLYAAIEDVVTLLETKDGIKATTMIGEARAMYEKDVTIVAYSSRGRLRVAILPNNPEKEPSLEHITALTRYANELVKFTLLEQTLSRRTFYRILEKYESLERFVERTTATPIMEIMIQDRDLAIKFLSNLIEVRGPEAFRDLVTNKLAYAAKVIVELSARAQQVLGTAKCLTDGLFNLCLAVTSTMSAEVS